MLYQHLSRAMHMPIRISKHECRLKSQKKVLSTFFHTKRRGLRDGQHSQTVYVASGFENRLAWSSLFDQRRTLTSGPMLSAASVASERPGWYESIADSAPVHMMENVLVVVQQTTGLPWWASVLCTTVALRTAITLPLAAYQMSIIAKVETLQPEIEGLAKRLRYEVSVRAKQLGWSEKIARFHFKKNLRRIVSELYVRDNCHPFKASLVIWVQIPMWVFISIAMRNLSLGVTVSAKAIQQELATGGALWFPDLTMPDTLWVMPVSLGLVNLVIVEIFALRKIELTKFQKYVTNFIRGISLVMIPIAATVPSVISSVDEGLFEFEWLTATASKDMGSCISFFMACLPVDSGGWLCALSMALYWLSSSCVGLGQNLLLRSPRFRRVCRIPRTKADSDTPYKDIASAFIAKYFK